MCNCLKLRQDELLVNEKKKLLDKGIDVFLFNDKESGFVDRALFFDGNVKLFLPFELKYLLKKKNGTVSQKEVTIRKNIFFTYCPFCGQKQDNG